MMIGLWGIAMMGCVLVSSFAQLIVARMLTAVGEAGAMPPTYSLLGDYFPGAAERTRSMTFYMLANPLSFLLAFVVGGLLNDRYGWRIAFLGVGAPALVLAPLLKMSIREPRGETPASQPINAFWSEVKSISGSLWHQPSARHLVIGLIFAYTVGLALAPWYGAFMMRIHGTSVAQLGAYFGAIFGIGGFVGVLLGGYVAERWFVQDERGQMRAVAVVVALLTPCVALFVLLPGQIPALGALLVFVLAANFLFGPVFALLQRLVADSARATAAAVVLLVCNLIGMGVGPQMVGMLSDALAGPAGPYSLRYSMLAISFLALAAAYHFWKVGTSIDEDLAARQAINVAPYLTESPCP